jgi:lipopolysaccharide transport system permease protein
MPPKPALKIVPRPPPVSEPARPAVPARRKLHTVIRGVESGFPTINLAEIWESRELAFLFAWRDIKLRYTQTVLGFAWTIIQPLLSTGVFTILFGKLAKLPSDGMPYPLFNFLGLLPWVFFVNGIGRCGTSLVANAGILTRVYFPRPLLPLGALLPGFVDLAVGLVSVIPILFYFGYTPSPMALFWIPILSAVCALQVLGISLFLSALHVRFRDVGNLIPFVLNFGLWMTPITYPLSVVPERYRMWVKLNPTLGYIEGYRNAFVGRPVDLELLGISVAFAAGMLLVGLVYFRKVESTFADIV